MFKSKNTDGTLNICGKNVEAMRKAKKLSQRGLAEEMQRTGLDMGKNTVQRIESGERFVTDIELKAFARYFDVGSDDLLV